MKNLNSTVNKKVIYIKNEVIFKIDNYDNGDECAMELNDSNVPYLHVSYKKGSGESATTVTQKLYLDNYIEVGDKYTSGDAVTISNRFQKTIHKYKDDIEQAGESSANLFDYYKMDCENQIGNAIIDQYYNTFEDFENGNTAEMLGIPNFMLDKSYYVSGGVGSQVVSLGDYQINFNKDYYNAQKKARVEKLVLKSAQQTADKYGYKITQCDCQCSCGEGSECKCFDINVI